MIMRTSNPVLNKNTFKVRNVSTVESSTMTVKGTANKTFLLLMLSLLTAGWTWKKFFVEGNPQVIMPFIMIGSIGGLICAIAITFKKEWAPIAAPIYALLEGFAIGGISSFLELKYHGIAIQAASLTFGTLAVMLLLYRSGIIPVTEKLRMGISAAVGAICLVYMASWIMSFFGMTIGFINGSSTIGIGFSILVVGVAAFSLLLNFDMIEEGQKQGAPQYMEWYGAFAMMVTLIWLYMEILRLLTKLRGRNR